LIWQDRGSIGLFSFEKRAKEEVQIANLVLAILVGFTGFLHRIVRNK